jgi:hypothetical protein
VELRGFEPTYAIATGESRESELLVSQLMFADSCANDSIWLPTVASSSRYYICLLKKSLVNRSTQESMPMTAIPEGKIVCIGGDGGGSESVVPYSPEPRERTSGTNRRV